MGDPHPCTGPTICSIALLISFLLAGVVGQASSPAIVPPMPSTVELQENCRQSVRRLDIVISHFYEDVAALDRQLRQILAVPHLSAMQPCVIMFTKNPEPEKIAKQLPYATVHWLLNMGREATAYLEYFIRHYDDLAAHIMMIHGNVERVELVVRKLEALVPVTGFMCLGYWGLATCDGGEYRRDVRMREVWVMVRNDFCFEDFAICYRGQFIVSAKRVQRHSIALYRKLLSAFLLPKEHVIYRDTAFLQGKASYVSTPDNPLLGHTMERAWSFMFGCHHRHQSQHEHQQQHVEQGKLMVHRSTHFGDKNCHCFHPPAGADPATVCTAQEKQHACQCLDPNVL